MRVKYKSESSFILAAANQICKPGDTFTLQDIVKIVDLPDFFVQEKLFDLHYKDYLGISDLCESDTSQNQWFVLKHSLTENKEYEVLGIEGSMYRILTDDLDPILFPPHMFELVNNFRPYFWDFSYDEDALEYAYPQEWLNCFFDKYFSDNNPENEKIFELTLQKYYPETYARLANDKLEQYA